MQALFKISTTFVTFSVQCTTTISFDHQQRKLFSLHEQPTTDNVAPDSNWIHMQHDVYSYARMGHNTKYIGRKQLSVESN